MKRGGQENMTSGAAIVLGPATVNLSTNSLDCLAKYLRVGQFNKWAMTGSVPCPSGNLQAIVVQKNCNLLRGKRLGDWHSCSEIERKRMAKKRKRKYSRSASRDVESEMRRYKRGTAKSGRGGKGGKVKSRKQAIAIGLSKARKKGKKVPRKKS
jgi:hypothetical protein